MAYPYAHTTRATGTTLTAAIYNSDHENHITNNIPTSIDDYSANNAQYQLTVDPGGVGSESRPDTLAGELERIRFCIKRITGGAQWYSAPAGTLADVSGAIANDSITNAKLANMAAGTYKMRVTGSTGDPEDGTAAQATAGLNALVGDSGSGGTKGLVPAPAAGDGAAKKELRADGTWAAPAVVSRAYGEYTANTALTTVFPCDDTIPQNTEGTEILSVSITPSSTTNRIRVSFHGFGSGGAGINISAGLFRDSVADALTATTEGMDATNTPRHLSIQFEHVPGTTSAVTYKIRVGPQSGTMRMNGTSAARYFGGVARATLVLEELSA